MWVYWIIFFLIVSLGAFNKYKLTKSTDLSFWFFGFVLFFMTAFKAEGVDNDYLTYLNAITGNWGVREPAFALISYFSYDIIGSTRLVFIVFSFLIVFLLFFGLRKLAPYFYLSLLVYYSFYFSVYGFNAIRAGVGIGFLFFALRYWVQNRSGIVLFFLTMASLFHFSFFIFFPLYLIVKDDKKNLNIFISLVPIGYLAYFIKIDVFSLLMNIPFSQIQEMIILYNEFGKDVLPNANVFGLLVVIRIFIFIFLIFYRESLAKRFEGFYLYFKLYSLGLFFFVFFSGFKSGAFRTAELFWVTECLLLPMLISRFNPRWFGVLMLIFLSAFMMVLTYILSDFLRPYNFSFDL